MVAVGRKAPEFSLPDATGRTVSLKEFRGKSVILYFYPKDDTPGCTKQACDLRDHHGALKKLGAVVLGVSADSVASHGKFAAKYSLPFTLLSDPDKDTIRAYGAWGKKSFMGKSYMGIVRTTVIIAPDGLVTHVLPKIRAADHLDDVLKLLKS